MPDPDPAVDPAAKPAEPVSAPVAADPAAAGPAGVPAKPPVSPLLKRIYTYRYALGAVVLLVVAVIGWFADDLKALVTPKPTAADIAGSWKFDPEEFTRTVNAIGGNAPADELKKHHDHLMDIGNGFRSSIYTFRPDGYSILKDGQKTEFACSYEGVPSNVIVLQPATKGGPGSLSLLLDLPKGRIFISQTELTIPLIRAP